MYCCTLVTRSSTSSRRLASLAHTSATRTQVLPAGWARTVLDMPQNVDYLRKKFDVFSQAGTTFGLFNSIVFRKRFGCLVLFRESMERDREVDALKRPLE